MFSVLTTPEKIKARQSPVILDLDRPHENAKQAFSNSFGFEERFQKLRFRDGLVRTVGLTVEIKMCFRDGLV